ncbi:MAG: phosphoglucomutase/phosphomannomutase family protein, partial [Elusimicrobia bacterium]|nr:phosphoglucomutase/phosphomannomutase family protein [Elusimicrobiota bacterium]
TDDIEKRANAISGVSARGGLHEFSYQSPVVELADLRKNYFKQVLSLLDLKTIKKSGLKVGTDPLYGAASAYLRPLVESLGLKAEGIHEQRDVLFGGKTPYTGPESLSDLRKLVLAKKLDVGIACDCDGDRFGIIDSTGAWISPNEIIVLVLEHLVKNKNLKGRVCKNVVTSYFIDAVAKTLGIEVRETPVGFKFIGELMRTGQYILGGEESGGLTIKGHVPEKDGMLACMLVLELMAYEKKPLSKLRADLYKKYGRFESIKTSVPSGETNMAAISERLRAKPPLSIAGFSVWRIDQTDGFKFILRDGSWLGIRPSGNEPLVRIYAESADKKKLEALALEGKKILKGKF